MNKNPILSVVQIYTYFYFSAILFLDEFVKPMILHQTSILPKPKYTIKHYSLDCFYKSLWIKSIFKHIFSTPT